MKIVVRHAGGVIDTRLARTAQRNSKNSKNVLRIKKGGFAIKIKSIFRQELCMATPTPAGKNILQITLSI